MPVITVLYSTGTELEKVIYFLGIEHKVDVEIVGVDFIKNLTSLIRVDITVLYFLGWVHPSVDYIPDNRHQSPGQEESGTEVEEHYYTGHCSQTG